MPVYAHKQHSLNTVTQTHISIYTLSVIPTRCLCVSICYTKYYVVFYVYVFIPNEHYISLLPIRTKLFVWLEILNVACQCIAQAEFIYGWLGLFDCVCACVCACVRDGVCEFVVSFLLTDWLTLRKIYMYTFNSIFPTLFRRYYLLILSLFHSLLVCLLFVVLWVVVSSSWLIGHCVV